MKELTVINDNFAYAGFISGTHGIWTRNEANDPPTEDYSDLSSRLGVPLSRIVRPYQANGCKVEIVGSEHGGAGVIADNDLKKVDGLITAEKGLVLSIIAADCVPVYLTDTEAEVIGMLHCGRISAAGSLISSAVQRMKELGASPDRIRLTIGPHICPNCYEVGKEVRDEYAEAFTADLLSRIFTLRGNGLFLDLSQAIRAKAAAEGISSENISNTQVCTCHDSSYHSYRRGSSGRQNLAFIMMKR